MREPALLSRRAAAALPLAALVGAAPATIAAPASAGSDATLLDLGRRWDALLQELETFSTEFHVIADAAPHLGRPDDTSPPAVYWHLLQLYGEAADCIEDRRTAMRSARRRAQPQTQPSASLQIATFGGLS